MSQKENYFNLFFNSTLIKAIIGLIPAGVLYYLSYTLPFIMAFPPIYQIVIPLSAIIATAISCKTYLIETYHNVLNSIKNLWADKPQDIQIFDMSFLITLSSLSSLSYALILGPAAPLVLYISPLITIAAINFSQYLKDIINTWLTNTTEEKLNNFKKIFPNQLRLAKIKAKDILTIEPNQILEADGILLSDTANIKDYTIRSGEQHKVNTAKKGDEVSAGTKNISGHTIQIEALRDGNQSILYKSIQSLETRSDQTENNKLINQVAGYFIPLVLIIALTTLVGWWWIAGFSLAFSYMMDVIFAACPCALGLANLIPFSILKNMLFANNIHIHKDQIITKLPLTNTIVFDKTGTLTSLSLGKFRSFSDETDRLIDKALLAKHLLESQKLRILANNSARANDPFAHAIISKLSNSLTTSDVSQNISYELLVDQANGLLVNLRDHHNPVASQKLCAGNKEFLMSQGFICPQITPNEETILVYVGIETPDGKKQTLAYLEFKQSIRADAKQTIEQLQNAGINVQMLTGDCTSTASTVASTLGIKKFEANCSPTRKKEVIEKLIEDGNNVVVVGDGFNDIDQAKAANVGSIAIGRHSIVSGFFDITIENLSDLPKLIPLAKATNNNQLQLFGFSIAYNLITILLAAIIFPIAGYTMMMGCFGVCMAFSSLFALVWSCLLIPIINNILGVDIASSTTDTFEDESFVIKENTKLTLNETYYPSDMSEYEFSLTMKFPCAGCINTFNNQSKPAIEELTRTLAQQGLQLSNYNQVNTPSHQSIIKFQVITNNPKQILELLKSQFEFRSQNIIKNSPVAEMIRKIPECVSNPVSYFSGKAVNSAITEIIDNPSDRLLFPLTARK